MRAAALALTLAVGCAWGAVPVARAQGAAVDGAGADSAAVDTTAVARPLRRFRPVAVAAPPLVVIDQEHYLLRNSISMDNWLEWRSDYFLTREGPVGRSAAASRWGIGRGRALVLLDGIEFNDPQGGSPPLADMPVSGLHELRLGIQDDTFAGYRTPVEGILELREPPPPDQQAHVFVDLSNGDRSLRQRRVRFSSVRGPLGIDLGYDEVLNNGYWFDATGNVPFVQGYGESGTRHTSARFRGEFDGGERWEIGFRRYTGDGSGTLESSSDEVRRNGHLATIRASVGRVDVDMFERGFDVQNPDSNTVNSTRGAYATIRALVIRGASLVVKGGLEDTEAEQVVGGALANNGYRSVSAGAEAGARFSDRTTLRAVGVWSAQLGGDAAWGLTADARQAWERHALVLSLARRFRLPSLGERFVAPHVTDGLTLAGNSNVGDEHGWELAARVESRTGGLQNVLSVSGQRMQDPIAFLPDAGQPSDWRVAQNGATVALWVLEERMAWDGKLGPMRFRLGGGVTWAGGDRTGFYRAVPELRAVAGARLGSELFKGSSALYLNAEWQYTSPRQDYDGNDLDRYDVLNVIVSGRLVDAKLYVGVYNVTDEQYETYGAYLMMPRTLVYGIAWTIFD